MSHINYREIDNLIFKVLENCSTDKDIEKLKKWFDIDPDSTTYYCDFVKNYTAVLMKFNDEINLEDIQRQETSKPIGWEKLAELEKCSPALELSFPHDIAEHKAPKSGIKRTDKLTLAIAVSSIAAVLIIAFNIFISNIRTYEIATITDSIDAQWSSDINITSGGRLTCSKPIQLTRGVVKIKTDKDVNIILEAPAEFSFTSISEIDVNYGKVYAQVSEQGYGFTVSTPNSKVMDLGTEFGVISQIDGNTEVYMYTGKASLSARKASEMPISKMLTAGTAGKVDRNFSIQDIPMQEDAVVRHFDSKTKYIWRGQSINLADIVGGGNGFGTGIIESGIDPTNGKIVTELTNEGIALGAAGYHRVESLKYVDGVFIPGFNGGLTQIATDSAISVAFNAEMKSYWGYIFNGAFHKGPEVNKHSLSLNGEVFGTTANPAISIHANQGITYDLEAIRKAMPGIKFENFRALAGISETVREHAIIPIPKDKFPENIQKLDKDIYSRAEFWVFIDGKKVFQKLIYDIDKAAELEIPIPADGRFLTLAVTEINGTIAFDWALFGRPELTFSFSD